MILTDTGFWVGLLDARDNAHAAAVEAARRYAEETFITTWPVLTEVCYFLNGSDGPTKTAEFLRDVREGACELFEMSAAHLERLEALMLKYRDLPIDIADASLVVLAEQLGEGRILTTDRRDFGAYRWKSRRTFKNLLLP